jgi:serine protease Do
MYSEDDKITSGDGGTESGPTGTEAGAGQQGPDSGSARTPYYEAWQQPVYRGDAAAGRAVYSPGITGGAAAPVRTHKKKRVSGFLRAVCLVLVCALAGGGSAYGVIRYSIDSGKLGTVNQVVLGAVGNTAAQHAANGEQTDQTTATPVAAMSSSAIYDMAVKQVVGVNSQGMTTNIFGQSTTSAVSGSGFIVSADGYIVTNYHVIQYAADRNFSLTVMLHDGSSYEAKIIGYERDNDVAVIKIDATGLTPVKLGTNEGMRVGDTVYAVGNPLGELDYSMTSGIVSALDRVIRVDESTSINMFQIDAAVNTGNSGGPVYNANGEVIGIVSAKYASTGVEGLGFAIPIDDAIDIITQLIATGYVSGKPSMGISVRTVTSVAAENYNLHVGAYVDSVQYGSAADKAGIKVGDIIISMAGEEVTSSDTLKMIKRRFKAGDTVEIVVFRAGEKITLSITFDEEGVTRTSAVTTTAPEPSIQPKTAA